MKNVLITGASTGLGKALAFEFASHGHHLILLARREDLLQALHKEITQKFSVKVFVYRVDITDEANLRQAIHQAHESLGVIDTVIANAGFGVSGFCEDLSLEDYKRQFDVNVFGVLNTLYATLADLQSSRGRFSIIASVSGYLVPPTSTAYAMSKFAVRALGEGLHAELSRHGISVTLVHPGFVQTDIRRTNNEGKLDEHKKDPIPSWLMMSSEKAARMIYRAITRRKREQIVTLHGRIGIWFARFFPGVLAFVFKWQAGRMKKVS